MPRERCSTNFAKREVVVKVRFRPVSVGELPVVEDADDSTGLTPSIGLRLHGFLFWK